MNGARHQTKFSADVLDTKAKQDLWDGKPADAVERVVYVALVLGLFSGLRRGESDKPTCAQVDIEASGVNVETTQHGEV